MRHEAMASAGLPCRSKARPRLRCASGNSGLSFTAERNAAAASSSRRLPCSRIRRSVHGLLELASF